MKTTQYDCCRLWSFACILMGLCAGTGLASYISYDWSYSGRGGALVRGNLRAQGIDAVGNLEAIFDVWFEIQTPFAEPTSMLQAEMIQGWDLIFIHKSAAGPLEGGGGNFFETFLYMLEMDAWMGAA